MIKLGTVFSGIGAVEHALNRLGIPYEIEFACDNGERRLSTSYEEIEKATAGMTNAEKDAYVAALYDAETGVNYVEQSYKANYTIDPARFYQDVKLLSGEEYKGKVDLFVGGSPCQSFSVMGKRGGLEEARGTLFYEYARLVKEIQPKVFIYEITRKALQIMAAHNVTSESEPEEIEATERELAAAGIYRDYESAKGRIRRALFTYFKAYGCINDSEQLTEIGRLFVENKITVQEICFHYLVNYAYEDDDGNGYYPVALILKCLKMLAERGMGNEYISAYDFSKLVECDSYDDLTDEFVDELLVARRADQIEVNERTIGFDVWSNMFIKAGIFNKTTERTLVIKDRGLADWILRSYEHPQNNVKGQVVSGVLEYLPLPQLANPSGDAANFEHEGKALQAFLFADGLSEDIICRYIFNGSENEFDVMLNTLGLKDSISFYKHFSGLERLVGHCLASNPNNNISIIGSILASIALTESELTEVMPSEVHFDYDQYERVSGGTNILLYGVPGSGKSWTIEHEYCTEGTIVERLVFHPDYTNADFVGQILPIVDSEDKQVTYEFAPGPFTNILRAAYTHPQQKYVLVIEEINRGNAPAIFGDVFQLLDRCAEEKTVGGITYPIGTSEYGITNENVAKVVYGDATHKVRIPANLSILGTMNTSDQNVFTLDTAFQRRWRMRLIENNFFNVRKSLAQAEILDTGVTWRRFCETINTIIIGNKAKMASAEDKRLGVYFVHESDLKFDDRAKPKPPHTVFASEYNDLMKAEIMNGTPEDAARLAEVREALMQIRIFQEKVINICGMMPSSSIQKLSLIPIRWMTLKK